MQLAQPKVAHPNWGPFSLKSAMEHSPFGADARQSAERPMHESEIFMYWRAYETRRLLYRKSRGTSHYITEIEQFDHLTVCK